MGLKRNARCIEKPGTYNMRIGRKEIHDECAYCPEVLTCILCRQGHGADGKRENITEMFKCQLRHIDNKKGGSENEL